MTSPLPGDAVELLRQEHEVDLYEGPEPLPREEMRRRIAGASALLCLLSEKIDAEIMGAAPNLKVIANYAVGTDNVDLAHARRRGIRVCNTPGVLTESTAELAFALLLAVSRRIVEGDKFVREGKFTGWAPSLFLGRDLYGSTVGVIGMGRIGQAFARRAKACGAKIIYFNRHKLPADIEKALEAKLVTVDELLRESDFVSLHCPLTPETRGLLSREKLLTMKPTAYLINTARGPVVDEKALVELLRQGKLAGAGFDVYENEPKLAPGLTELPNVVLAPHVGSATIGTRSEMARMCARAIIDVLAGREPKNAVA
ncbi:MAG: D-glycerate dehydrogenase [Bdellovibrionota bacterium]